jgi:hypothetical protein
MPLPSERVASHLVARQGMDAADDSAIVRPLDAPHIRRQVRFDPLPLLIAQPWRMPLTRGSLTSPSTPSDLMTLIANLGTGDGGQPWNADGALRFALRVVEIT